MRFLELKEANGLVMMYILNNGLAEIDIKYQYLVPESQVRTSRHLHNLAYKVVSSSIIYHKFSFFPRTVKEWQPACRLPLDMVELPSLASFKARLAKHF